MSTISNQPTPNPDWTRDWQTAKRILCVRLDTIGDVIMTGPAMRALKQSGDRHITLMTSSLGARIAPQLPDIDDVIVYDSPWLKATAPRQTSQPEYDMVEQIRGRFDAAVIFTVYSQNPLPSAMMCYLADIPLRLAHCHENPYQLLTHWIRDPEPAQFTHHEVQRQLGLVASVGATAKTGTGLSLSVSTQVQSQMRSRLTQLGLDLAQPWVVLHAGASALSRRYPPELFAVVARSLVQQHGIPIVFTGVDSERDIVESVRQQMQAPSHTLVGQLSLEEMTALLAETPLLLSNNTGPVHMAAAVATPVVDLYALTNPQHTPWEVPNRVLFHDVPCRICYKSICPEGHYHCLRKVEPQQVVEAVLDLLAATQLGQAAVSDSFTLMRSLASSQGASSEKIFAL
ncbi:MAG: lipopolysaccharide heptosyltransferase II [Elainellaceae cyanobacterium]